MKRIVGSSQSEVKVGKKASFLVGFFSLTSLPPSSPHFPQPPPTSGKVYQPDLTEQLCCSPVCSKSFVAEKEQKNESLKLSRPSINAYMSQLLETFRRSFLALLHVSYRTDLTTGYDQQQRSKSRSCLSQYPCCKAQPGSFAMCHSLTK